MILETSASPFHLFWSIRFLPTSLRELVRLWSRSVVCGCVQGGGRGAETTIWFSELLPHIAYKGQIQPCMVCENYPHANLFPHTRYCLNSNQQSQAGILQNAYELSHEYFKGLWTSVSHSWGCGAFLLVSFNHTHTHTHTHTHNWPHNSSLSRRNRQQPTTKQPFSVFPLQSSINDFPSTSTDSQTRQKCLSRTHRHTHTHTQSQQQQQHQSVR